MADLKTLVETRILELRVGDNSGLESDIQIADSVDFSLFSLEPAIIYLRREAPGKVHEIIIALVDSYVGRFDDPSSAFLKLKQDLYSEGEFFEMPRELDVVLKGYD